MNDCQKYWAAIDNKSREEGNRPEDYYKKNVACVDILTSKWDVPKDASILELGTNVGTNLHILKKMGYTNISGVEINPHALEMQKKVYPELDGLIINSSIEDFVTKCDKQYDCVFSMAVLMHVPHESDFIYPHIAKLAKQTIVTLEHECEDMEYIHSRNYKHIFEPLGFTQVYLHDFFNNKDPKIYNYNNYTYRVLKRQK